MKRYAILAAALLATPAAAVTIGGASASFYGNTPQLGEGATSHWSTGVTGPYPVWGTQNPDGPGAKGLPPHLTNLYACSETTSSGIGQSATCGLVVVSESPPPCLDCEPPVSAIPLPAGLPLLLGALAGLGWLGMRRG